MADVWRKGPSFYTRIRMAGAELATVVRLAGVRTKAEARQRRDELVGREERRRLGLDELPSHCTTTLGELCTWWLTAKCPEPSRATAGSRLRKHIVNRPIGGLPLPAITTAVLEQRLDEMAAEGLGPVSINHLRRNLHTVYAKARKAEKWKGENPAEGLERRAEPKKLYIVLRPDQVEITLSQIPAGWQPLFAAALFTAMRKGELFGMRKTAVDLQDLTLRVEASYGRTTTKGKHADLLPIAPSLVPYLKRALETPGPWLFPAEDGEMRKRAQKPEGVLRRALARAGLVEGWQLVCRRKRCRAGKEGPYRADVTVLTPEDAERRCPRPGCAMRLWAKPVRSKMRFHELRHSTATLLLNDGVSPAVVQRILRHSNVAITTGTYAHMLVGDLRAAVARLPAVGPELLPQRYQKPAPEKEEPDPLRKLPAGSGSSKAGDTGFEPVAFGSGGTRPGVVTRPQNLAELRNRLEVLATGATPIRVISHPFASVHRGSATPALPAPEIAAWPELLLEALDRYEAGAPGAAQALALALELAAAELRGGTR